MNFKPKSLFLLTFASTMILSGCGGNKEVKNSSSNSIIEDDPNFSWSLENQNYLRDEANIVISKKENILENVSLQIGEKTFEENCDLPIQVTIRYNGIGINSDNSNNAADYIYLNSKKLQKIPSNGQKGVTIDEKLLVEGENVVTVTIGRYWSTKEYDISINHGNKWQSCDDFQIGDFHLMLPTQKTLYPTILRKYYPKTVGIPAKLNNTVVVEEAYNPNETFWIGDGWGEYDTYYNHENPRFNIPFKVDFVFNYHKESYSQFIVDTKQFKDDNYTVKLFENDRQVLSHTLQLDNTKPDIKLNILNNSIVNVDIEKVVMEVSDNLSGMAQKLIKVDNIETSSGSPTILKSLKEGKHTISVFASDKAGNETFEFVEFYASKVGKFSNYKKEVNNQEIEFSSSNPFSMTQYQAKMIELDKKQGIFESDTNKNLTLPATSSLTKGLPYHSMIFSVHDSTNKVLVNYEGGTTTYERFAIKAKNQKTQKLDTLATGYGVQTTRFILDVTDYKKDGKVELYIVPDFVVSKSDTMIWVTDTQHYTKFDDLNDMLYKMMEYCAKQYVSNKAGYFIHTGDLVDDNVAGSSAPAADKLELVNKQWNIASNAHKIIEDVDMPNGVVTGNHDTGSSLQTLDYSYFGKFFGQDRFNQKPWFGGSLNNNASHYDLITIADIDFMIVYLGYGVEGDKDTIAWANNVISRYPNRNVILTTHDYLAYNNGNGKTSDSARYDEIFNEIIVPNENVKMVLCGHDNGAFRREVAIPNSDRKVYEILSDYQFVDSNPSKHYIGSVAGCSGDGYLRLMSFNETSMSTITYTPYFDKYNPFGKDKDEFTLSMNYVDNNRVIISNLMEVYELSNESILDSAPSHVLSVLENQRYVVCLKDEHNNFDYQII